MNDTMPNSDYWLIKGETDDSHALSRLRGRLMQCDFDLYRTRELNHEKLVELIEQDAKTCRDAIDFFEED